MKKVFLLFLFGFQTIFAQPDRCDYEVKMAKIAYDKCIEKCGKTSWFSCSAACQKDYSNQKAQAELTWCQTSQQQSTPLVIPQASSTWTCHNGHAGNIGKFCTECGNPAPNPTWTCSCGHAGNTGKFCAECGKQANNVTSKSDTAKVEVKTSTNTEHTKQDSIKREAELREKAKQDSIKREAELREKAKQDSIKKETELQEPIKQCPYNVVREIFPFPEILDAIKRGNVKELEQSIKNAPSEKELDNPSFDFNKFKCRVFSSFSESGSSSFNLLRTAITYNKPNIVKYLVEQGHPIGNSNDKYNELFWVVSDRKSEIARILINNDQRNARFILNHYIKDAKLEAVKFLHNNGTDINTYLEYIANPNDLKNPIKIAGETSKKITEYLIEQGVKTEQNILEEKKIELLKLIELDDHYEVALSMCDFFKKNSVNVSDICGESLIEKIKKLPLNKINGTTTASIYFVPNIQDYQWLNSGKKIKYVQIEGQVVLVRDNIAEIASTFNKQHYFLKFDPKKFSNVNIGNSIRGYGEPIANWTSKVTKVTLPTLELRYIDK